MGNSGSCSVVTTVESSGRVLCVGRLYCDLIFTGLDHLPRLGEKLEANGVALQAGGGAYITAAYLAALGRPVSLLASLPTEPFAATIKDEIRRNGIEGSACKTPNPAAEPQITVAMAQGDERAFVTRRSGSALPDKDVPWHRWPELTHVHIGELTTLLEYPSLIADARVLGLTVSLDCGWDDAALSRPDIAEKIAEVDVFLPNAAEFRQLQEVGFTSSTTDLCVIKRGAEGADIALAEGVLSRPAMLVDVVDTTGAGDAFNAGFLHAWLAGQVPSVCLESGNRCGALSVRSVGGAAGLSSVKPIDYRASSKVKLTIV